MDYCEKCKKPITGNRTSVQISVGSRKAPLLCDKCFYQACRDIPKMIRKRRTDE
jgi:hypothetical protein